MRVGDRGRRSLDDGGKIEVLQAEAVEAEAKAELAGPRGDWAQAKLERARAAGMEVVPTAAAVRQAEAERQASKPVP